MKKINGFQLLTSLAKGSTSDVLQGCECTYFQLTINISKTYMAKTNHRRTLRQLTSVFKVWWTLEKTLTTESNDLPAKLALTPHPASSFIENLVFSHYNNSIHEFALSSVRNSNIFSFDTVTSLHLLFQYFIKKKSG